MLDFLILAFHFDVLFGQLLGLLRELLVGLLQFGLLGLQLGGQLLRLLQQAFGLHGGLDAVQHDADARGELFEESQMRGGENAERRQFDDRLHAVFKKNGQNDNVSGNGLE